MTDAIAQASQRIRRWRERPSLMVRELFGAIPDPWQDRVLDAFPTTQRQAMTACKGPGKTALLAWLVWNFLLTRIDPKILCTSVTGDNLSDGLWSELAKWQRKAPLLVDQFTWTGSKVFLKSKPEQWFASARTWPRQGNSQEQANTLAGFHADHALAVLDEAGGIPIAVLAAAEAVLAGGGDQHIVMAGNPTQHDGALGYAVLNDRKSWEVTEITGDPDDPMRSSRVDAAWARKQIDTFGRENPWVLVNVFGRFPPGGLNTLISPDEVRDAQKRHLNEYSQATFPKIIGVDVARFGDDESVIFKRQGKIAFPPIRFRNLDTLQGAAHTGKIAVEWGAASIQIDATGGFGAGWYDQIKGMGWDDRALPVQFAGKARQPDRYYNKRAEMMFEMVEWIKDGGCLPPVPEMVQGLSTMTYSLKNGRFLVEEKEQIKARLGGRSPDLEDALACTFAFPIASAQAYYPSEFGFANPIAAAFASQSLHTHDYEPTERHSREAS
jgi:phage terminase large subunit